MSEQPSLEPAGNERPDRSTRDPEVLSRQLGGWLATKLGLEAPATVTNLHSPTANGMSSETILFDAEWHGEVHPLVARLAPDISAVPVFETYDLVVQGQVMRAAAAHCNVPIPEVLGIDDGTLLGGEFFVMRRIDGIVPPDVMPYNFGDSWLFHASPQDQRLLQDTSVAALVGLHGIDDPTTAFAMLDLPGDSRSPLRRHVDNLKRYYEWAMDGRTLDIADAGFAWIENNWPANESDARLSWGDARIGNMMFRDFEPVAVLDWEMASIAPREVDLGWMIFLHRFFEDLAVGYGFANMPTFMRRADVESEYARISGYIPRDMDFYTLYAALRHAVVMARVTLRSVHFGTAVLPEKLDDMVPHKASLQAMIDGTYWANIQ